MPIVERRNGSGSDPDVVRLGGRRPSETMRYQDNPEGVFYEAFQELFEDLFPDESFDEFNFEELFEELLGGQLYE